MELLIVTGMSGAGKSQTANILEDIGFYCVDNVPPAIILNFVDMAQNGNSLLNRTALVTDARGGDMFSEINSVLKELDRRNVDYKILFLDSADDVIVRRYKENRRKHPLDKGEFTILESVKKERETLQKIRKRADFFIDTSLISIAQLKETVFGIFNSDSKDALKIQCKSFGFKYGPFGEADLVFDVRCLPNPFYEPLLKEKTGLDKEVKDFVMDSDESREFLKRLTDFIDYSVPLYVKEGKSQLTIAFGCTGGKHRSVTFAELIGNYLIEKSYKCSIIHRDILKR